MSRYGINSVLFRLKMDPEFRARFKADRDAALVAADLTDAEREAFKAGDLRALNQLGGYLHLVLAVRALSEH